MAFSRVDNPPNPWHATAVEYIGPPPTQPVQVFVDHSKSILSRNDSPDLPFRWSVNPYRGCFHGCAYCYARPSHEYLGFGAGSDFDRRIVIKPDAPALLAEAFARRSWVGERVVFSGNTDCYQPLEASYRITRGLLEVCVEHHNPVFLITKSPLIERDIDLLARLHREAYCAVAISLPFSDPAHARALEPTVAPPARRLRTISRLAEAGVPVGVFASPVIPGLNDAQVAEVLEQAYAAGARFAASTMLRLPGPVAEVFAERLRSALPLRADRVLSRLADVRGGALNDARFGRRMRGDGPYAEAVRVLFEQTRRRLGYGEPPPIPEPSPFRRPARGQLSLL